MLERLELISLQFKAQVADISDSDSLEEFRIKYFGRKGLLTVLFDEFKDLSKEEKPKVGKQLNVVKKELENIFDSKKAEVLSKSVKKSNFVDISLPGKNYKIGSSHIVVQTLNSMIDIFKSLGFSVYEGPELESDYYNFEMLNFPPDHPARDMQDTYFVTNKFLLRTHTSPTQIRLMEKQKPPIRAIMPGKVYRNEAISAKSYNLFHQVEGLFVDTDVTFAELKGTLLAFIKQFFGKDVNYRFRPSFFPFTEPSAEVDIWWEPKNKPGRWLEILGCGMVDPNVLNNVGVDSEKYTGYAFGIGIERTAMRKYGINDIRLFFDNDNRFLNQF